MLSEAPTAAVMNTSEDTTDLLRVVLEQAGFTVITVMTPALRDAKVDFDAFVREHQPDVIVYDIAVPYEQNWRLFQHFRSRPVCASVRFVLTTTNVARVQQVAGKEQLLHEIVGKPYDLDEIVRAVKEAAHERPTR